MPYAVAAIGALTFLAGFAAGAGRYVSAGFLVATAVGVSLWLRYWTLSTIEQAFEKGAGYGTSTRYRLRSLPEVVHVPERLEKKRFMPNG